MVGKKEDLVDLVFSWSVQDVLNEKLYGTKVKKIPKEFSSVDQYLGSFIDPLVEETRADLQSSLEILPRQPLSRVKHIEEFNPNELIYDIFVEPLGPDSGSGEAYIPKVGDVFALTNARPSNIGGPGKGITSFSLALVSKASNGEDDDDAGPPYEVRIRAAQKIEGPSRRLRSLFAVYLVNLTTNLRVWAALRSQRGEPSKQSDLNVVKNVLNRGASNLWVAGTCNLCSDKGWFSRLSADLDHFKLNESQKRAISGSFSACQCTHGHRVRLICGPPGTGKTKTVSILLWTLLGTKCRTLACAPTNVAVLQVASRLLHLVKDSCRYGFCSLGSVVLFGNKDRMKVEGDDLEEVFLDYRVDRLAECFGMLSGWNHQLTAMTALLDDPFTDYKLYLQILKEKEKNENGDVPCDEEGHVMTFMEYFRKRFNTIQASLMHCIGILITHFPTGMISSLSFMLMVKVHSSLGTFEYLLRSEDLSPDQEEEMLTEGDAHGIVTAMLSTAGLNLLALLRRLQRSLKVPNFLAKDLVRDFCLKNASLIFCTVSSSARLQRVVMEPLDLLIVDEAAQLKECESLIPLQLPVMRHAVLIGDEMQLPALVKSKVSEKAEFGRSLFERLSSLGYMRCLLDVQYRMHPKISSFPNKNFYDNRISDAENVKAKSYNRRYLKGPMYGPYSFINVGSGKEMYQQGRSPRNMAEVAVVSQIVKNLFNAIVSLKRTLSVGIISPYSAQIVAIREKLGNFYENHSFFSLRVVSVDGFQGGEEDVIIISTVRSNERGDVGFLQNCRRTNVALTRARHCLWVVGNEPTLTHKPSVWKRVILDAKRRGCFFDEFQDKSLAEAVITFHLELQQHGSSLHDDSLLSRSTRLKVFFTANFRKSFAKIKETQTQKEIIQLLVKWSEGWRPKSKDKHSKDSQFQSLQQYNYQNFCILWTEDILDSNNVKLLKFWDISLLSEKETEFQNHGTEVESDVFNRFAALGLEPKLAPTSGCRASASRSIVVSSKESKAIQPTGNCSSKLNGGKKRRESWLAKSKSNLSREKKGEDEESIKSCSNACK